jgi:hypothetical protein
MIIENIKDTRNKISRYLGGEYSFWATILRGGTGSVRLVYVSGQKEFDDVASQDSSLSFCSFQIYKAGFAIRIIKKGNGQILGIQFAELKRISFATTPIRTRVRRRIVIRYRAEMMIDFVGGKMCFNVLQVHYKSFKKFLVFNFDEQIIEYKLEPIEEDTEGDFLSILSRFVH